MLLARNLGPELGEVRQKLRDNGSWGWSTESVIKSVGMNKSPWKVQKMKTTRMKNVT